LKNGEQLLVITNYIFFANHQRDFEEDEVIFFENLDTSHLLPINGFWYIRFDVCSIYKIDVFRAGSPTNGWHINVLKHLVNILY